MKADSLDGFDAGAVSPRRGQRQIARDDCRIERLCQRDIHRVVGRNVLAKLPRTSQEVEMSVAVEIEVSEIGDGFGSSGCSDFIGSDEPPECLSHLDVYEVR